LDFACGGVAKVAPFRVPRIHEADKIVLCRSGFTCNLVGFSLALNNLMDWSSSQMHLNFIHEFYIMLLQFKHLDILIALKIHLTNHFCWKKCFKFSCTGEKDGGVPGGGTVPYCA
jgi:hypothetical protein